MARGLFSARASGIAAVLSFVCSLSGTASADQCGGASDALIRDAVATLESGKPSHMVVDWAVAPDVRDLCPTERLSATIAAAGGVTVWMRSAGNTAALERLKLQKRLPLRHVWARKSGTRWRVVDTMEVTGTTVSSAQIDGLGREAAERGFFDWRTYSRKNNLRRGDWKVTIIDRLGERVTCRDSGAPCEIEFHVE